MRIVRTQMLYDRKTGFSDWFENAKTGFELWISKKNNIVLLILQLFMISKNIL